MMRTLFQCYEGSIFSAGILIIVKFYRTDSGSLKMQVVMKYYMRPEINSNEWSYLYLAIDIQPSWKKAKHELDSFINVGMYWYHDKIPTHKKQHQLNLTLDSIPSSTNLMHAMYSLGKTNSLRVRSTDVQILASPTDSCFSLDVAQWCFIVSHTDHTRAGQF